MKLPELPIQIQKRQYQTYRLQGLDRSDDFGEGSLWDTNNITSKRLPYFTTCNDQSQYRNIEKVTDITAWDKLLYISNGHLFYDNVDYGEVSYGEKQFAVINTKIVVFPDKKYLDLNPENLSPTLVDMVNRQALDEITAVTDNQEPNQSNTTSDTEQTITITGGSSYADNFKEFDDERGGDYVTVELSKEVTENDETTTKELKLDLYYAGKSVSNGDLILKFRKDSKHLFDNDTYTKLVMYRKIPNFDFICSAENRIWGCESATQTIFASELGVPTRFFTLNENSYDSFAVNVGTPADFTGCCALGSSILFYKEYCLHKVIGSSPAEYSVYTYDVDGVQKGSHKSMQVVNDTVYYLSNRGVMVYSGGATVKISDKLGNIPLSEGIAGTDGAKYYLSCNESRGNVSRSSVFSYDIKTGIWLRQEETRITGFARLGGTLYVIKNGKIYYDNNKPLKGDWKIQFNDMFESTYNNYGRRTGTVLNKKRYSKLIMRVEMPKESYAVIKIRVDGGKWEDVGHIVGRSGVFTHVVPINRCDKFGILIEGKGEFTLLAMEREYIGESVRNE